MTSTIKITIPSPFREASPIRMQIRAASGGAPLLNVRYAPVNVTYGGFERDTNEVTRPGRKPILGVKGRKARTMSMEIELLRLTRDASGSVSKQSVDSDIQTLISLADSKDPVKVLYDTFTGDVQAWRITSCTVEAKQRNTDDAIIHATASVTFTESHTVGGQ